MTLRDKAAVALLAFIAGVTLTLCLQVIAGQARIETGEVVLR